MVMRWLLVVMLAASLFIAGAGAGPLPSGPGPTHLRAHYDAANHTAQLTWDALNGTLSGNITYNLYQDGQIRATVAGTQYVLNVSAAPVLYYVTATNGQSETMSSNVVTVSDLPVCWPVAVVILADYPYVWWGIDKSCFPAWIPWPI